MRVVVRDVKIYERQGSTQYPSPGLLNLVFTYNFRYREEN